MECFPGPSVPQAGEEPPAGDGGPRAARRRLRAKTPAMPSLPAGLHAAALAAEQEDDSLEPLAATVKRKHVHYTHVRTGDPGHVQPDQMSRRQFWEHLVKVYAEVYPSSSQETKTGAILAFGLVVTEHHKKALRQEHRDEHKHAATFSTAQH